MANYSISALLNINEVTKLLGVSKSTLRYWEDFFRMTIARNSKNTRIYTQDNIEQFQKIKDYAARGLTLKDIKDLLGEVQQVSNSVEIVEKTEVKQENPQPELTNSLLDRIERLHEEKARLIARNEFLEIQNREYQNKLALLTASQGMSLWGRVLSHLNKKSVNFA
jgi:DNA-binding transcriptional MerR regulator